MFKIFKFIQLLLLVGATLNLSFNSGTTINRSGEITNTDELQDVFTLFKFTISVRDLPIECWLFLRLQQLLQIFSFINEGRELKQTHFKDILLLYDNRHSMFSFLKIFILDNESLQIPHDKIARMIEHNLIRSLKGIFVDIINNFHGLFLSFIEQGADWPVLIKDERVGKFFDALLNHSKKNINNYETKFLSGCLNPYEKLKLRNNNNFVNIRGIEKDLIENFEDKWSEMFKKETIFTLLEIIPSLIKNNFEHYYLLSRFKILDDFIPTKIFVELVQQPTHIFYDMLVYYMEELYNFSTKEKDKKLSNNHYSLLKDIKNVLEQLKDVFKENLQQPTTYQIYVYIDVNLWVKFQRYKFVKIPLKKYFDFNLQNYKRITTRYGGLFYFREVVNYKILPTHITIVSQLVCNKILEALNLMKQIILYYEEQK